MGSGDGPVINVTFFTNIIVFWHVRVFLKCLYVAHRIKLCSRMRPKVINIVVNQNTVKFKEHLKPKN
jgi:hypothetical protein